jgi:hypothetical protein
MKYMDIVGSVRLAVLVGGLAGVGACSSAPGDGRRASVAERESTDDGGADASADADPDPGTCQAIGTRAPDGTLGVIVLENNCNTGYRPNGTIENGSAQCSCIPSNIAADE